MLQNLTGWHALIVLAVIVLIFGAAKLPALARSLGQSVRILRTEVGDSGADTGAVPADRTDDRIPLTTAVPVSSPPSTT